MIKDLIIVLLYGVETLRGSEETIPQKHWDLIERPGEVGSRSSAAWAGREGRRCGQ